jgi:hypothetical protein
LFEKGDRKEKGAMQWILGMVHWMHGPFSPFLFGPFLLRILLEPATAPRALPNPADLFGGSFGLLLEAATAPRGLGQSTVVRQIVFQI